jgi:steroid 5-alpha reductase family enzyme
LLQLILGLVAVLLFFTMLWGLSLRLQNTSVAEAGWGLGVLVIGLTYYFTSDGFPLRAQLTLVLLAVWACRLAAHLGLRMRLEGEDYRHVKWRDEFEEQWWIVSYVRVFLLQAVVAWVISLPIYFAIVSLVPPALTLFDYLGVLLVLAGLFFEAVGDEQLRRFRGDRVNQGKVLDTGLWKYTRHPNYFGEALLWWGFGLIGLATGGLPGLLGPAIFTYLLLYVSGVAPLESTLIGKPGYSQYVGRTPSFLPLPPQVRMQIMQFVKSKLPGAGPPPQKRKARRY